MYRSSSELLLDEESSTEENKKAETVHNDTKFNVEDEVHSMESKFKEFNFRQTNNVNTQKCIDFWKLIADQPIKPAPPIISYKDCGVVPEENTLDQACSCDCYVWCKALRELQKRNMDKLALHTSVPKKCKLCKHIKNTKNVIDPTEASNFLRLNKFMELKSTSEPEIAEKSTQTEEIAQEESDKAITHRTLQAVESFTKVFIPSMIL